MSENSLLSVSIPGELPRNTPGERTISYENFVLYHPEKKQYIYVDMRNGADWPYFTPNIAKAEIFQIFDHAAKYKRRYINHIWDKASEWEAEKWEIWHVNINKDRRIG